MIIGEGCYVKHPDEIKTNFVAHCSAELTWCFVIIRWSGCGDAPIAQQSRLDI